jgi:copper chaperone
MSADKTTTTLGVKGMTCLHCAMAVEKALKGVSGAIDIEVDLTHKKASVTYDPAQADEQAFRDAVAKAGYEVV